MKVRYVPQEKEPRFTGREVRSRWRQYWFWTVGRLLLASVALLCRRICPGRWQRSPSSPSGIDLAFVRELARALGGTLTISDHPAEGMTLTLRLPRVRTHPAVPIGEAALNEKIPFAEQLVRDAEAAVHTHLEESTFGPRQLARTLGYSLRNLERRLKAQTGRSPSQFIRELRLRSAYRLLENATLPTVSEVGMATGFASAAHFSRVFSRRFGVPPSEVMGRMGAIA